MWTNAYFAHNSQDGTTPFQRMTNAGYNWITAGENIAAGSSTYTAAQLEDLLMVDSNTVGRGHRVNLLDLNTTLTGTATSATSTSLTDTGVFAGYSLTGAMIFMT